MSFSTHLLDNALQHRRELNEKQRLVLLDRVIQWLEAHGQEYGIEQAYIFGSLTCPNRFAEHSDVDVAVETVNLARFFEAIAILSEAVERDVDLVDLSKCPFANQIRQRGIRWTAQPGRS
jgi:uncharacterized protein